MAHYFTADTHFGDEAIMRTFDRPFADVAAMDAAMLAGIEARVGPGDDLWIIGDLADCDSPEGRDGIARLFPRIPGRKHLVRGNHDNDWTVRELGWASIHDLFELSLPEGRFVLCHYPLVTWNGVREGAVHLFGHVHLNWKGAGGQVNVGVDPCGFRPLDTREAIIQALSEPPAELHLRAEGLDPAHF